MINRKILQKQLKISKHRSIVVIFVKEKNLKILTIRAQKRETKKVFLAKSSVLQRIKNFKKKLQLNLRENLQMTQFLLIVCHLLNR